MLEAQRLQRGENQAETLKLSGSGTRSGLGAQVGMKRLEPGAPMNSPCTFFSSGYSSSSYMYLTTVL